MKPAELYARKPSHITHDLDALFCGNLLPELDQEVRWYLDGVNDANKRVAIHVYKEHWFDHRRFWRLAAVYFDDRPVMIIRNAGREGDDHVSRFVTDVEAYRDLVPYVNSLLPIQATQVENVVDPESDIPGLTSFYDYDLNDRFERY